MILRKLLSYELTLITNIIVIFFSFKTAPLRSGELLVEMVETTFSYKKSMLRTGYLIEEIVVGLEKNTWHHVLAICLPDKPVGLYLNKSCKENGGMPRRLKSFNGRKCYRFGDF